MLNVFGQEVGLPITCDKSRVMYVGNRAVGWGSKTKMWTPLTILEVPSAITGVPVITFATDSVSKINLYQTEAGLVSRSKSSQYSTESS